jgi:hypothetical protein
MKTHMNITAIVCSLLMSAVFPSCDEAIEPLLPSKGVREGTGGGTTSELYHEKAYETYQAIERLYGITEGAAAGLYNENYPKGNTDGDASFLWPYDGYVTALANMNRLGYDVNYAYKVENYERYLSNNTAGGWGYSSSAGGWGERYYDDNSIVGINLVEAYNQLKKPEYLERCARIVKFLKTGVDDTFGGGLWWCEQLKNQPGTVGSNKPACANGFAQWFLLGYYEICPDNEKADVLAFAKSLYNWVFTNLRDNDYVYLNDKGADGKIHATKWAYNSGAMIAAGYRLYKITGEQHYLDEAIETADAAYNYFVRPRGDILLSYPLNDPWFTNKLIEAYIELLPEHAACQTYIATFIANLDRGWLNGRQTNGLWYEDWSGVPNDKRDCGLLMQDAALDALGIVALYKGEKKTEE